MAQSGYTPISLYYSATASAAPLAANLVAGELAINTNDGKLYYKDSAGVVQTLASKGAGTIGGANTQVQYNNNGALAGSANLTFNGTTLTAAGLAGPLNGTVGATTPSTGAFTTLSVSGVSSFAAGSASAPALTRTGDTNTGIFFPAADTIAFAEGGVEAMRLDSSANMGLGVTPCAWDGSVFRSLQTGTGAGSASLSGRSDGGKDMVLGSNLYYGTSSFRYVGTGTATMYRMDGATHAWSYAASGTAGNAISFTQAMTLDASGNLAVGGTTAGYKMNVSATNNHLGLYDTDVTNLVHVFSGNGNSSLYIGADDANVAASSNLIFAVDGSERARIDSSGNFLIGTTSSVASGMTIGNATGARSINGVVNGSGFSINATDTVNNPSAGFATGHITSTSQYAVRVGSTGGLQLNGAGATAWTALSDETTKDIIEPITDAANKVSTLRAVIGKYKTDEEGVRRSFLIAQDVQAVLPEAVSSIKKELDSEETALGLAYTDIIPLLVAAIKEQQAIITQLQADIAALKGN